MPYLVQIDDIVREATPEEAARFDALRRESEAQVAALEAVAAAKASARAKLAALGLSEDEVAALLGA